MKVFGKIENRTIYIDASGNLSYVAKGAIDCVGSDNRFHDPCWQADTSLHHNGRPIDAESVPYVVVPPLILKGVKPVVLGCLAKIKIVGKLGTVECVVADVGPRRKLGELSCEAARRLGLDGNPNHGGTDEPIIPYEIFPGIPAIIDGIRYKLQPS